MVLSFSNYFYFNSLKHKLVDIFNYLSSYVLPVNSVKNFYTCLTQLVMRSGWARQQLMLIVVICTHDLFLNEETMAMKTYWHFTAKAVVSE